MAKRHKKRERRSIDKAEVPLSSMIDIVFLLLVYFVVTAKPQLVEAHMQINLPSPSAPPAEPKEPPRLFKVDVLQDDQYKVMDRRTVGIEQLRDDLIAVATFDPTQTVMIRVANDAWNVSLIQLLDACEQAGLSNLNVVSLGE